MLTTPASAKRTRTDSSRCARDPGARVPDNQTMSPFAPTCAAPTAGDGPEPIAGRAGQLTPDEQIAQLKVELSALRDDRERAECMAAIQRDAVQLALDLLVTHPDLRGFFRMFVKDLVEQSESHACGVWLLEDATGTAKLWIAHVGGESLEPGSANWRALDVPRESMSRHLSESGAAAHHKIL